MRVGQLRRHDQLKVGVVRNRVLPELDHILAPGLEFLLEQDGLQRRLERLADVLQQRPFAEAHRLFQRSQKVLLRERDDIKAIPAALAIPAAVADEAVRLTLRVDEESPPPAPVQHDRILRREVVAGQALQLPRSDLDRLSQSQNDVALVRVRDVHRLEHAVPPVYDLTAKVRRKGPEVGHGAGGDEDVANDVEQRRSEILHRLGPPRLLAPEAADELVCVRQTRLALLLFACESAFFFDRFLERLFQELELLHDQEQPRSGLGQRLGRRIQLRRGLCQSRFLGRDAEADEMVLVHRVGPHADRRASHRGLFDLLGRKVLVGHVRPNPFDDAIRDVVLVEVLEHGEELVRVCEEHLLCGLEVVVVLLARRVGVGLLHRRDLKVQAGHFHGQPNAVGRVAQGLDFVDVRLLQFLEALHGGVERGQGFVQVLLGVVGDGLCARGDAVGFQLDGLHLDLIASRRHLVHVHLDHHLVHLRPL
mmetsp:Transcript_25181/g.84579  ORF Transcript_25181/g.84579 Transcript_25181/m.84579 type:complete len:478 (-) Transcript_25181:1520-2953(-)